MTTEVLERPGTKYKLSVHKRYHGFTRTVIDYEYITRVLTINAPQGKRINHHSSWQVTFRFIACPKSS